MKVSCVCGRHASQAHKIKVHIDKQCRLADRGVDAGVVDRALWLDDGRLALRWHAAPEGLKIGTLFVWKKKLCRSRLVWEPAATECQAWPAGAAGEIAGRDAAALVGALLEQFGGKIFYFEEGSGGDAGAWKSFESPANVLALAAGEHAPAPAPEWLGDAVAVDDAAISRYLAESAVAD